MDDVSKEALVKEFRDYLDGNDDSDEIRPEDSRKVDLFTLLSEFVALKTEVKIEARQFKSALEKFDTVLDNLNAEKSHLSELLDQDREKHQKEKKSDLRALLTQLLDLRDRINAGLHVAASYKPRRFSLTRRKREQAIIQGLCEGQELTLKRIDQLLATYNVHAIEVVGDQMDPATMRAAEIEHIVGVENGEVTTELRKGFYWGEEVLRTAEVRVNKV